MSDTERDGDQRLRDDFLDRLAHELRNPLAPIQSSVDILRHAGGSESTRERALAIIEHQLSHLVRLIAELTHVSQVTRGTVELERAPVEVRALVREAVDRALSRPANHSPGEPHEIEVELADAPLVVQADRERLEHVMASLLRNAMKFSPAGSRIHVAVDREGQHARIAVRDEGVGIAADKLEEIFGLFRQVDADAGGLGVGLTLARSIVELHGGTLVAQSEGAGLGSEFVLRLPLSTPADTLAAPEVRPGAAVADTRIVVVDDNRDAAESLYMLLTTLGANVRVVYDGNAALEAVQAFRPEIVLLDIGMPGMDGYEVARKLHERPDRQDILLVALTGWAQPQDVERAKAAGFDLHLTKPVTSAQLMQLLADYAARQ
ncbi:MAG TPA: ATP-binding protein [Woeseiaceae bacterium]|nr:ATP-binding protein [Woeseiaceae bacterium]